MSVMIGDVEFMEPKVETNMSYWLFLDDERDPPDDGTLWVICRTVAEACDVVCARGFPEYVSFDNDLGENQPEGREFARWLIERDLNMSGLPEDFGWYAHTQNPVARDAINNLLEGYLRQRTAEHVPFHCAQAAP